MKDWHPYGFSFSPSQLAKREWGPCSPPSS